MKLLPTLPQPSKHLLCTLMLLEQWKLIEIKGEDTIQYLQGQLTCDLYYINNDQYTFAVHCNPQGKIISNMYVLHVPEGIGLIERSNICHKQIIEMEKYAVFSKIKININQSVTLFGVAGYDARKKLNIFFKKLPDIQTKVIRYTDIIILHFHLPHERFLLIVSNKIKTSIIKQLTQEMQFNDSLQWIALDIEAGYPLITTHTTEKIIPQAANIHLLKGISYNKGCYIGQEIIARTKYKNINKKSLYWLIGDYIHYYLPKPGDYLETKTHEGHWRANGLILESCIMNTKEIWIQAILHNFLQTENAQLRTINKKIILKLSPLPYQTFHQ